MFNHSIISGEFPLVGISPSKDHSLPSQGESGEIPLSGISPSMVLALTR